MAGHEYTLDRSKIHYKWDNSLPPAIEIESGDTVHCETEEVSDGQIGTHHASISRQKTS